jgi:hypothetical protein
MERMSRVLQNSRSLAGALEGGAELASQQRGGNVGILLGAVSLGVQVAAGDAVVDVCLDLDDAEPASQKIDGQAGLDAPAVGEGLGGIEGSSCQAARA